jgi:hypothetical protein
MASFKDLASQRFGRLVAREFVGRTKSGVALWRCDCDCGSTTTVQGPALVRGNTQSCECLHKEKLLASRTRHGLAAADAPKSRTYNSWNAMRRRCQQLSYCHYAGYGGRGIKVCERWLGEHGFENFLADMGERPEGKTLDRYPNNDGNYEPLNCRWATAKEQRNNQERKQCLHFSVFC